MFHRNNLQPISYKTIYCVLYCVCYVMLSSVCGSGRKSLGTVKYFSCFFSACGAVCVCLWSVRSLSSLLNVYSCKLRRRQFSVRVTSLSLSLSLSHSLCLVLSVYWLSGCLLSGPCQVSVKICLEFPLVAPSQFQCLQSSGLPSGSNDQMRFSSMNLNIDMGQSLCHSLQSPVNY